MGLKMHFEVQITEESCQVWDVEHPEYPDPVSLVGEGTSVNEALGDALYDCWMEGVLPSEIVGVSQARKTLKEREDNHGRAPA